MIKFLRVDHRLMHGQIIYSWLKSVSCDTILIANDDVAQSETRKNGLRLAKPADIKLVMKSIDDTIEAIKSGITDKYHMFVVVETIHDLYRLVSSLQDIRSVNLGGTIATKDSKPLCPQIYVTKTDLKELKSIGEQGIDIEYRLVPNDAKVNVNKKLEGMKL